MINRVIVTSIYLKLCMVIVMMSAVSSVLGLYSGQAEPPGLSAPLCTCRRQTLTSCDVISHSSQIFSNLPGAVTAVVLLSTSCGDLVQDAEFYFDILVNVVYHWKSRRQLSVSLTDDVSLSEFIGQMSGCDVQEICNTTVIPGMKGEDRERQRG